MESPQRRCSGMTIGEEEKLYSVFTVLLLLMVNINFVISYIISNVYFK